MFGTVGAPFLPTIESLSLPQLVAQMVVVRASGYLFDHQIRYPEWEPPIAKLQPWIKELGVGGVILLGGSAAEIALKTQQLQSWAQIPLLISADVEEGVGQRFAGATWFPPPMALAALLQSDYDRAVYYAREMGRITAAESLAIGLNWVLAPIFDVNNNPDNPVINVRAFGETAQAVSHLATAFLRGLQKYPVLSTAKHFPGHGDTAVDSHLELPVLPHSAQRLATVELPPFRTAIAAGVDTVMSAHLQIPAWDANYPATLSPQILTEELRHNLEFEGLIVTDALVMGAIANRYGTEESAVLAVEAGADILLMPLHPDRAIAAVCAAVEAGRISEERIQSSVERIWRAKQKACAPSFNLHPSPHAWENQEPDTSVESQGLTRQLAQPESLERVREILRDTQQVHLPQPLILESSSQGDRQNLILVDNLLNCDFLDHTAPAVTQPQQWGYRTHILDCHSPDPVRSADTILPTLLQLFIRGNPFRGSAGLTQKAQDWLEFLVKTQQLQAVVVYGSPFALKQLLPDLPETVPYVFTYGQMPTAQQLALAALTGEA